MGDPQPRNVTQLLEDWSRGDRTALDRLMPLVHDELHRLARGYLAKERPGHTLQPTALINEAYLKLVGEERMRWNSRAHFIGVAAHLMRFILVDHFRAKHNQKRAAGAARVTFDENLDVRIERSEQLLALDDALTRLAAQDPRKARIAELRYFGGLTVEETAETLHVSVATIMREWRMARAWLQREVSPVH